MGMLKSSRKITSCLPPRGPNLSFERFSMACSIVACGNEKVHDGRRTFLSFTEGVYVYVYMDQRVAASCTDWSL